MSTGGDHNVGRVKKKCAEHDNRCTTFRSLKRDNVFDICVDIYTKLIPLRDSRHCKLEKDAITV